MPERKAESDRRVTYLQYLRAVAALLVVYYHAALQVTTNLGGNALGIPIFGRCGVDIFFVISGFVMWTSTSGRRMSFGDFIRRRIVRVVPLYWIVTAAACVVALAAPQLLRSTRFEALHALTSLFFVPFPNPALPPESTDWISPIVIPGWTLNYEMMFYLLFGLSLFAVARRLVLLAALLVVAMIVGHALRELPAAEFYGSLMLLEFLAGVVIARVIPRKVSRAAAPYLLAVMIVSLASIVALDATQLRVDRAIILGIPAMMIVLSATLLERATRTRESSFGLLLGDASYSLYLTHIFVIAASRTVVVKADLSMATELAAGTFIVTTLVLSVVAAVICYRLIEQPATRWAGRLLLGARPRTVLPPIEARGMP